MPAKQAPEAALDKAVFKTLPKDCTDVAVTAAKGELDLTPYAHQWIWFRASGGDVTLLLGERESMTAGKGWVVRENSEESPQDPIDFYVDPNDTLVLSHIAGGNVTLEILHD